MELDAVVQMVILYIIFNSCFFTTFIPMSIPADLSVYLNIALRSAAVYAFMLFAFRVFGKRELSQLSISDLVLVLLISNAVQNAMVGENTSLQGGLVAASILFLLNYIIGYLKFKYRNVNKILHSEPVILIYDGKINKKNMNQNFLTISELEAAIREHGVEKIEQVHSAILENDGNISVISNADSNLKKTVIKRKRVQKTLIDT